MDIDICNSLIRWLYVSVPEPFPFICSWSPPFSAQRIGIHSRDVTIHILFSVMVLSIYFYIRLSPAGANDK